MALISKPKYTDENIKPAQPNVVQQGSFISNPQTQQSPNQQNQGSGQFTNIQKIVNANKQAGEQIGQAVSGQVQKNVQGQQKAQEQAFKAAGSGLTDAQNALTTGQGYYNTLKQGIQQATSLAQDPNKLLDVTKFRTGAGVDEQALGSQVSQAQQQTDLLKQQAEAQKQAAQTQSGRFNLIKQAFARPSYTSGQQQLDSTLFGTSGKAGIGKVQDVAKTIDTQAAAKQIETQKQNEAFAKAAQQEQDLMKGITSTTTGYVSDEQKRLSDEIGKFNAARDAKQNEMRTGLNRVLRPNDPNAVGTQDVISDEVWNALGLQEGQNVYNVLDNMTPEQIVKFNQLRAQNIQDVAKQEDVDRMKALQALKQSTLGEGNTLQQNYQNILEKAGDMGSDFEQITGENSVANLVKKADERYKNEILNEVLRGHAEQGYTSGTLGDLMGGGGTVVADKSLSLKDILAGIDPRASTTDQQGTKTGMTIGATVSPGNLIGNLLSGANGGTNLVNLIAGNNGSSGAQRSVNQQVIDQILGQAEQRLKDVGAAKRITKGGITEGPSLSQIRQQAVDESNQAQKTLETQLEQRLKGIKLPSIDDEIPNFGMLTPEQMIRREQLINERNAAAEKQFKDLMKDPKMAALEDFYNKGSIARSNTRGVFGQPAYNNNLDFAGYLKSRLGIRS